MPTYDLAHRDSLNIWHPLTQHKNAAPSVAVVKAKGAMFYDEKGKGYIDAIASWYTSMYGHGNPQVIKAITAQMKQLDFVIFSGLTHAPAIELAERLLQILPTGQAKVFFNDNGSTAIEAAIKMAFQYHYNRGEKRDTLIAFEDGFHGDTFGAMSASGLSSYNGPFEDLLLKVVRIPVPQEHNIQEVTRLLRAIISNNPCAAFVFEPLVQGAAGMKFHSAKGLDALIATCQDAGILCIADEIMTGFGKTGKNFASDYLGHLPDIICLGKALTAGMFPLSITSCTQKVFDAFLADEVAKGFFHAHTFSAHPLGCAAAIAALDLLTSAPIMVRRAYIAKAHEAFKTKLEKHAKVKQVRCLGVILAFELTLKMDRYGGSRDQLYQFFMDHGVHLRPLGNTIYVLPPYVITNGQLKTVYKVIQKALDYF